MADEFETFAWYRDQSVAALYDRMVTWSPRPVSELAIFLYAMACERLRRPLFADVLAVCWSIFVLPSVLVLIHALRTRTDCSGFVARAAMAAALPVVCLMAVELPDAFLWPMAALAYLPGIAAVFGIFLVLLHDGQRARRRWLIISALGVFGTCCVEMAGIVVGILFSGLLVRSLLGGTAADDDAAPRFRMACCLAPMLATAATGLLVLTHRARLGSPLTADDLLVHRPWASIAAAMPIFLRSLAGEPASIYRLAPAPVMANLVSRIAWCAGTVMLGGQFVRSDRPAALAPIKLLGLSIVIAGFGSVAATLYQFGIMCCERQDTSRTCFEYVALACLGVCLAARLDGTRLAAMVAPVRAGAGIALMLLALAAPLPHRLDGLAAVYREAAELRRTTAATWRSGWRPSAGAMRFYVLPRDALIGKARDDQGLHRRSGEAGAQVRGIMSYFGKENANRVEVFWFFFSKKNRFLNFL